jgi:putative endonuclease
VTGTSSARVRGAETERIAETYLRRQGYRIVARNVTYRFGEIDLVAREGETLAFVEVKSRTDGRFGPAVLAVDRQKRRRVILAARAYLTEQPWEGPVRFDVLGIDGVGPRRRFTLLRNAFEADEG